ncbi:MAG: immunoglobulin domain-containing protein, partial [Verrucomicrobiales bacterium]|nr:immunoglobulin domain-containing protein [Verrucomicrobiales bacterium]
MKTNAAQHLLRLTLLPAGFRGLARCVCLLCLTGVGLAARGANLTWTTNVGGIYDGSGTWNQGAPSVTGGGGAWYDGSSYGVTMQAGDNVTFGNGLQGTGASVYITNGVATPGNIVFLNNSSSEKWNIGTNGSGAGNAITMNGGIISNSCVSGSTVYFYAPVNGSFKFARGPVTVTTYFGGNGSQTAANTITIQSGTLTIGNGNQYGGFGAAIITNNGGLTINRAAYTFPKDYITFSNTIYGAGTVQYNLGNMRFYMPSNQYNTGAVVFGPASGFTTWSNSVIQLQADNALAGAGAYLSFANKVAGGTNRLTLDLNGYDQQLSYLISDTNGVNGMNNSDVITNSGGAASTLTLAGANPTVRSYNGLIGGNINLTLTGCVELFSNNLTYTGITTLNGGTLALGGSGSISNTAQINIGAGGVLDVSGIPAFSLGSSTALSASGTNTAAIIKGAAGGTVNLGAQPITLTYDGAHPALTIAQGQLLLNGNAFTVNSAAPLASGSYVILTNVGGTILTNNPNYAVTGTAIGSAATLDFTASSVVLTVGTDFPPTILVPPASQYVQIGSNATFSVTAAGTPPLGYQWQFNGTNVDGATATNYTLTGVTTNNIGSYTVVVTNAYGSVTSSVAALTICPLGLYVVNGTLMHAGQPFRGMGMNYFDCFYRTLQNGTKGQTNTSYQAGFSVLASKKIPFVRFAACGFWPNNMKLYVTNQAQYFAQLDAVVRCAETNGVGLIPSLFFADFCVPDLVGESVNQWGNTNSLTIAFMRTYLTNVISRYSNSPAIWGWEFGNEYNSSC